MISALQERILILDGGMGTMIQQQHLTETHYRGDRFREHPGTLVGNHDILVLTQPEIIASIHRQYIDAGADIIETCTFSANAVSQSEYGTQDLVRELCLKAAQIARSAADNAPKRCFVAGSVGPAATSLSIASDVEHPDRREIDFDAFSKAYEEQIEALIEGGVDAILMETIFDPLNTKAAFYALQQVKNRLGRDIPVMISATIADQAGRLLSGQSLEAFVDTVIALKPLSIGLNCGFGVCELGRFLPLLSQIVPRGIAVSCYPNAGLPDDDGCYHEDAEMMASHIAEFARSGCLNIAGGCCGTTPDHIRKLAQTLRNIPPRPFIPGCIDSQSPDMTGLSVISSQPGQRLIVAERANVTGSRKFKRLIEQKSWDEALDVARDQMKAGAHLIDICMDDAMLDAPAVMREFLRRLAAEPEISRYPICLDSSHFDVIKAGLRECQGRCLVNSISLKNGEADFLERAREIQSFGGIAIVMAFDEQGQASSTPRRIEILTRAIGLLLNTLHYREQDIAIDPNILAIGTGLPEHDDQAVSFIETCREMRSRFPRIHTIGGLSNLSFSFRGRDDVRTAIHQAFLNRAGADLTMVIANPASLNAPVDPELADLADALVANASSHALENLLNWMNAHQPAGKTAATAVQDELACMPPELRLIQAFVQGIARYLQNDILALSQTMSPLAIIEGPLMRAMNEVGDRFGRGEMFLPQIVKAARLMKQAIGYLDLEQNSTDAGIHRKKVLLATVWGDVHDIGKNIVNIVLSCNGYEVIDLGVMVETDRIVSEAARLHVDAIGLSGLISPSLSVMVDVARALNQAEIHVPLLVGGAAANEEHTALKLAPAYAPGIVCHTSDASRVPGVLASLLSSETSNITMDRIRSQQREIRTRHAHAVHALISLDEARKAAPKHAFDENLLANLSHLVSRGLQKFEWSASRLADRIHWPYVTRILRGQKFYDQAQDLEIISKSSEILTTATAAGCLVTRGHLRFVPARPNLEDIELLDDSGHIHAILPGSRALQSHLPHHALADFVAPHNGAVGLFALTTSITGADDVHIPGMDSDVLSLYIQTLSTALVDVASDVMHETALAGMGPYICPAPGYPIAPDHAMKRTILELVQASELPITLTESLMMQPLASVCGFTILHPDAHYFSMGIENSTP